MKTNNKPIKQHFFNKIAGEFDTHVRQSIPLFGEATEQIAYAIAKKHRDGRVLDVCGSTGELGRMLLTYGFRGTYVNIDGSPEMIERMNKMNRISEGMVGILGGYYASWTDESGVEIPEYTLDDLSAQFGQFDVIVESLGFQFFTQERRKYVNDIMKHSKDVVFIEKFKSNNAQEWEINEHIKDKMHKSKYFTEEQLENKRTEVLIDMGDYLAYYNEFEGVLGKLRTASGARAHMFYHAGNFRGYTTLPPQHFTQDLIINKFNA